MRRIPFATLLVVLVVGGLVATTADGSRTGLRSATVVKTAFNKTLKKTIVVDGAGRTLYMFTADVGGKPEACAALGPTCTKLWPAYTSTGAPVAGKGIKAALLGVATGPGGKKQVVFNHHPLYYFAGGQGYGRGDRKAGDVGGNRFGNVWFVLSPKGTPIK